MKTYTLTWPQIQELIARCLEEQIEYFAEHEPHRTQTANAITNKCVMQLRSHNVTHH